MSTMSRILIAASTVAVVLTATLAAQDPASLSFEVASVKQSTALTGGSNIIRPGGRWEATNMPLRFLIRFGYGVQDDQLADVPGWADTTNFTIIATSPLASPTRGQMNVMIQRLLAERFQLRAHMEMRDMPVYDLDVADRAKGPRLKPGDAMCPERAVAATAPPRPGEPIPCGNTSLAPGSITARAIRMPQLIFGLSNFAGRHVIDKTGLTGTYDIDLRWTPDAAPGEPVPAGAEFPTLFTAIREQLGLRLVPARAPLEVLVVDSVSMPSPD